MSLFPAYNNLSNNSSKDENSQQSSSSGYSWLNNSSFTHVEQSFLHLQETSKTESSPRTNELIRLEKEPQLNSKSDIFDEGTNNSEKTTTKHRSKHKKHKKSKISKSSKNKHVRYLKRFEAKDLKALMKDDDEFYEDRRREIGNLTVDTLHRPAVPKYHCPKNNHYSAKSFKNRVEKSRKGRYFLFDWSKVESENFVCGSRCEDSCDKNESEVTVTSEEDILEKTSRFNKQLAEDPNNIELWMQYINFQDSTLKYQPVTANFSSARKKLAIADKKLAIVEKALTLNPLSDELLKEKLLLAELLYPPGKLKKEAEEMLMKDPTNLLLWRAMIHSSQYSLAQCTVPGTQIAYANALERIHHASRGSTRDSGAKLSKSMIELLFECMLFMRQAGLWEHLLTLVRLYLELNLAIPGSSSFKFNITIPEEQIREVEDTILHSGLPMPAIWLRIERLRELCYWLPVTDELANDSAIDPQRIVFANDVSNLLHPVTDSSLNLQSAVRTILLLKVPLLPTSDAAVRFLQLDQLPSSFDLVESLLAALYPSGLVPVKFDSHFLKGITELTCGPQYLLEKLCRTEFLNLIHNIIERCGQLLHPSKAVILFSWYIRLCRFLMCVSALDGIPLPTNHKKSLKAFSKGLLKKPEFRDELCLYSEYALVERDMGNLDSSLHILQTAAKLRKYMPDNAAYSGIHRNLVETLLRADPINNRQKALDILCNLVSTSDVNSAAEKFHHASIEMMLKLEKEGIVCTKWELEDVLKPHYLVEWTACHAFFLLLTQTVWASAAFVEKTLDAILPQAKPETIGMYICEGLYEILINILHFHCVQTLSSFSVLQKIAYKAHGMFPNNMNILHVMGLIETNAGSAGSPWWKLTSVFTSSKSIFAKLFLIFISRARIESSQKEAGWTETSGRNQMHWLFGQLMIDDQVRHCPLFWRLCLQFFALHKDADAIKKTFYKAVEECPWVKAIYMDAVQLLPENLQEIQDLLIEKELRLHSLLDELEILRSDAI